MIITTGRALARVFVVCVVLASFAGCTTVKLPNVTSFAEGTATLYQANAAETRSMLAMYDDTIDLSKDVLRQSDVRLPQQERELITSIRNGLKSNKTVYADSAGAFDHVLQQAVAYSEQLAQLAAAGETGAESAVSLAGSINQFGAIFGPGAIITDQVSEAVQKIADYRTRVEAQESLHEAAQVAQGAVVEIADLLKQIHGGAQQRLVSSLASDYDELLSYAAGKSIIGYHQEANDRRDMFYRRALLALKLNDDGISGFCRDPQTGEIDPDCINLSEMQALSEVEDRLMALEPEVAAFKTKRSAMQSWRNTRRANGRSIIRAVNAWVREHQNVVDALESGGTVSTFSLRAILTEIKNTN